MSHAEGERNAQRREQKHRDNHLREVKADLRDGRVKSPRPSDHHEFPVPSAVINVVLKSDFEGL